MEEKRHKHDPAQCERTRVSGALRVGPLMNIAEVLIELGVEPEPIFVSAGFKLEQFANPDTEISYAAGSRLLERCVAATGCQHFGLLLGERACPSLLGVAGFMLSSACDVGTALRELVQHLDLHDRGGVSTLLIRGDETLFGYAIHQSGVAATNQIYDLSITMACTIMRSLVGESWTPTEVLLPRRAPLQQEPYKLFFRAPLHFNADQSSIVFPSHWLDCRIPSADALLHSHLDKEASELHAIRDGTIVDELRGSLRKSLLSQECTISSVARQLSIHERTLHRRLREQGTSFRSELEDIRQEMAQQLLAESTMSIAKIASALNYSDASAFSRAFNRWSGMTPGRWRARNMSF